MVDTLSLQRVFVIFFFPLRIFPNSKIMAWITPQSPSKYNLLGNLGTKRQQYLEKFFEH